MATQAQLYALPIVSEIVDVDIDVDIDVDVNG